ncbi:MAG TPA: phosphatase PAP2 family protein [Dehalococcoidia bacterium]|nr:phosphatase PAP2 family protein [Dehalococcoidia bacterium]
MSSNTLARPRAAALSRPWYFDALWQLVVAAGGYIVYSLSVGAVQWAGAEQARHALALANARHVIDFEQALGIFRERQLQSLIIDNDALMQIFNAIYMWAHLPLIILLAVWLYWRHRPHFRVTRNAVLISGAIALIVFQIVPLAPPRLVPGYGFVDTAAKASGVYDTVEPKVFFNPYAAIPSMHVGWVLLMGLTVWQFAGARRLAWLGLALPVLMTFAVVITGNHYFSDAVAGVGTALIGRWLAGWAECHLYRDGRTAAARTPATSVITPHAPRLTAAAETVEAAHVPAHPPATRRHGAGRTYPPPHDRTRTPL